ncbi:MAG: VWA domain-containing protein [Kofleriaceae bacterium]|nr:VWA domain-containing protein [Kofleriaceae bacterium]
MSRGLPLPGLAVLALLVGSPALADETDDDVAQFGPAPDQVHIELAGTTLMVSARFSLDLEGPSTSEGATSLTMPPTAMVTRATATIGSMRYPLQLADADAARTAFDDLIEGAPSSDRKAMLLLSGSDQTLTLDTALPRRTRVLLDLRLEMPTCYFRDARYALLPKRWFDKLDVARPRVAGDDIDGACAPANAFGDSEWLAFPTRELARKPPGNGRIGAIGGRLELDERHLARIELDLSRELSAAPADLHTAIVIDHSRSVMPNELEAERAIVASYLQRVPAQSRVQVIGYARTAKPMLPDWMPAAASAPRVDREIRALAPRNGSNVDSAIAEAARWLARAKGPRRLIVFTDDRIASRIEAIEPATFKRTLPDGTLVHVVSIFDGRGGLVRNDDSPLAPLAQATAGLAVSGGPDDKHQVDATLLVRPISVDQIHISGPGWTRLDIEDTTCPADNADDVGLDNTLAEGQACTWWGQGDAVSGPVTIEGLVWGRRVTRVVRPDPSQGISLARMLSATQAFSSNEDESLQELVDRAAFALNSVWSMVATWGGSGGYADTEGFGTISGGSFSSGCCSDSIGDVGIGVGTPRPPLDLRAQLAPVVAKCGAGGDHFAITLETTSEEITDVAFEGSVARATEKCLVEGTWDLSLKIPNAPWRASTRTEF